MEIHQLIHDNVRPRPPVIDIPYNMKVINGQVLDQMAQRYDELVRNVVVNDGVDDLIVVQLFVVIIVIHMEQLINNVGKLPGHLLSHLGAGVLGGYLLAALHQPVDGNFLPILRKMSLLYHSAQIPLRIVDQICQLHLFILRYQVAEGVFDLLSGNTGG